MQTVRAKMVVHQVNMSGHCQDGKGVISSLQIAASPVTGKGAEENKDFSKWTPSGKLELSVTNPDCFEFFKPGAEIYVDISHAVKE